MLLQEPYIDTLGNTKANHNWRVLYPTSHLTNNTVKCSVILVNATLNTNTWSQLSLSGTNDVTAIQFRHSWGKITIFNIYNACEHSATLWVLDNYIELEKHNIIQHEMDAMMWCSDFNWQYPMWDEEHNHHLFTAEATRGR